MRRSAAALLVFAALPLAAEWRSPDWYLQRLNGSKTLYNIEAKPAATPIDEYTCKTPVGSVARIRSGGRWTLGIPKRHPDSAKLLREAEALFDKKQYAEAAVRYRKMIELDANDAAAHLLYGDVFFFGHRDYAAAVAEYRKALAIDATNAMAHFFSANALMRLGRGDEARAAVVSALSYNPVYEGLYRVLDAQPEAFGLRPLARHRFDPPRGYLGKPDSEGITVYGGNDGEWRTYAICKAALRYEPAARKEVLGDAEEVEASFEEERACVTAYVDGNLDRTRAALEKAAGNKPVSDAEVRKAAPPLVRHLVEVLETGFFDGYVAFEIIGQRCPIAAPMYPEPLHQEVEKYVARYVVVKK
ncbi:MAG TPA: tetratricopeptide repeat protein [Thermoanaerobaculia bacterium]